MNHYKILGLQENATEAEIKTAYRKLAMLYHPDRNSGNQEAEIKFKQIQAAYDILNKQPLPKQKPKKAKKSSFEFSKYKSDLNIYSVPPRRYDLWGQPISANNWKDSFAGRYESEGSPDLR